MLTTELMLLLLLLACFVRIILFFGLLLLTVRIRLLLLLLLDLTPSRSCCSLLTLCFWLPLLMALLLLPGLAVPLTGFLWFVGVLLPHSPAHGKARLHSESEVASSMRNTVSAYLHTASTTTRTQTDSAH